MLISAMFALVAGISRVLSLRSYLYFSDIRSIYLDQFLMLINYSSGRGNSRMIFIIDLGQNSRDLGENGYYYFM